jgi:hypothetical protein
MVVVPAEAVIDLADNQIPAHVRNVVIGAAESNGRHVMKILCIVAVFAVLIAAAFGGNNVLYDFFSQRDGGSKTCHAVRQGDCKAQRLS